MQRGTSVSEYEPKGVVMKICMLGLLGALLVCGAAYAADADVDVDADASVAVETSAPVDPDAEVVVDAGDATVRVDTEPRRSSLRDEYRQWSRANNTSTRRTSRYSSGKRIDVNPDSTDDFDSVNDIEGAGRDIEDWANEDVANSDRDDYVDMTDRTRVTRRHVDRFADYPEYEDDAVIGDRIGDDRMYDDYDRGGDRYWSRSYGDVRYYDSREGGCPCNSCSKCGRSYGGCSKCGSKCGGKCGSKCGSSKCGSCNKCASHKPAVSYSKCGPKCDGCNKCASHKPAVSYTPCNKCVSKCSSCHKPAATCGKCGRSKCGKCGSKSKCSCDRPAARKCSKC